MRVLGVDLAWAATRSVGQPNETGVVALDPDGTVVGAGWTRGVDETLVWMVGESTVDTLAMIDASLVVANPSGQRLCEKQVGQRYGRWKVAANSTNLASPRQAGQDLRLRLAALGWRYASGFGGPPTSGRHVSECYPYTTLVGAAEFGYDERPVYKRKPRRVPSVDFSPMRAAACDGLIGRLDALSTADPPLHLRSHPVTAALLDEPSPLDHRAYKHREDLIDAVICAWTGQLWLRFGLDRCQVLGHPDVDAGASIITPARPEQRRE